MASHRYWRVNVTATNGAYVSANEIEFASTVGGSAITGGSAIYSSQFNGTTEAAANAFDGNFSSHWTANATNTATIGKDFGSAVTVREMRWTSRSDYFNSMPRTFTVEGSDDNSSWTVYAKYLDEVYWSMPETRAYGVGADAISVPPASGLYYFWRILITATSSTVVEVAEWALRSSIGGSNLPGRCFSSGWDSDHHHLAQDGNTLSRWRLTLSGTNYIGWTLFTAVDVAEFWITVPSDGGVNGVKDFKFQKSADASSWTDVATYSGVTWTNGETKTYSFSTNASPSVGAAIAASAASGIVAQISAGVGAGTAVGSVGTSTVTIGAAPTGVAGVPAAAAPGVQIDTSVTVSAATAVGTIGVATAAISIAALGVGATGDVGVAIGAAVTEGPVTGVVGAGSVGTLGFTISSSATPGAATGAGAAGDQSIVERVTLPSVTATTVATTLVTEKGAGVTGVVGTSAAAPLGWAVSRSAVVGAAVGTAAAAGQSVAEQGFVGAASATTAASALTAALSVNAFPAAAVASGLAGAPIGTPLNIVLALPGSVTGTTTAAPMLFTIDGTATAGSAVGVANAASPSTAIQASTGSATGSGSAAAAPTNAPTTPGSVFATTAAQEVLASISLEAIAATVSASGQAARPGPQVSAAVAGVAAGGAVGTFALSAAGAPGTTFVAGVTGTVSSAVLASVSGVATSGVASALTTQRDISATPGSATATTHAQGVVRQSAQHRVVMFG